MTEVPTNPLADYETAFRNLKAELPSPSSNSVVAALVSRDQINHVLQSGGKLAGQEVLRLALLDGELREAAVAIDSTVGRPTLSGWQQSMDPASELWWWSLHEMAESARVKLHPTTAWLVTILLGVSFVVTGDTVGQLLKVAAISAGLVAILIQAALTFLAGSVLIESGRKWVLSLLTTLGLRRFRDTKVMALAAAVFALSILARMLVPELAGGIYARRAEALDKQSAWSQAIYNYTRALTLRPDDISLHLNLAIAYDRSSQFDRAIEEYKVVLASDGENSSAQNNLARLFIIQRTFDPALRLLDQLSKQLNNLSPEDQYYVLKNLGWVYVELQHYEEAKGDLWAALRVRDGAAAHYLLGLVHEASNKSADAQKEFGAAIAIARPQAENAPSELEPEWIIHAQRKQLQGGKGEIQRHLQTTPAN